jgi:hypothetical protein
MPRRQPPHTEQDAVQRVRAWLDRQHDRAHRQVLRLLCETSAEAISKLLEHSDRSTVEPLRVA